MTFEDYCAMIRETSQANGHEMFLPSLYVFGIDPALQVLDWAPHQGAPAEAARSWAEQHIAAGRTFYLAYRGLSSIIHVQEYAQGSLARERRMLIQPAIQKL